MKTILILEDNGDRIAAFERIVAWLVPEYELKLWHDEVDPIVWTTRRRN